LAEEGLVELRANPAHRRSPLVGLTTLGERLIRRLRQRERRAFGSMEIDVSERQLEAAARTLRALRLSLGEEA